MKKPFLILTFLAIHFISKAQKVEFSAQANTGMFRYTGSSAKSDSYYIESTDASQSYTNDPYGNHFAASYGIGLKLNIATKSGFIFGLNTDYEVLRSKVNITGFTPAYFIIQFGPNVTYAPASNTNISGSTNLVTNFVNFSPYIGYRFKIKKVSVDVMPGFDAGTALASRERGNTYVATGTNTATYAARRDRGTPPNDIRLRLGAALNYDRYNVNASYAKGYTNYVSGMVGGNNLNAQSQLLRLGVGYKLN